MTAPDLVVTAAELADYLRIPNPDTETIAVMENALADAQADVTNYLGWPIPPAQVTDTGCWPWPEGWKLSRGRVVQVLSTVAETYPDGVTPSGYFAVTYLYGLDAAADPELEPVRRFILRSAADAPGVVRVWLAATGITGTVRSKSTDGQSITYEDVILPGGSAQGVKASGGGSRIIGPRQLGAAPTLESLSRWRNRERAVYQRRVVVPDPFTTRAGRWY